MLKRKFRTSKRGWRVEALKSSAKEFQEVFRGSVSLSKTVGDKIFLAMSNLYFFNCSKGMQMDFSAAFHPILVHDFEDMFVVRVVIAHWIEFLAEEVGLHL
jgi:hypothetical protein